MDSNNLEKLYILIQKQNLLAAKDNNHLLKNLKKLQHKIEYSDFKIFFHYTDSLGANGIGTTKTLKVNPRSKKIYFTQVPPEKAFHFMRSNIIQEFEKYLKSDSIKSFKDLLKKYYFDFRFKLNYHVKRKIFRNIVPIGQNKLNYFVIMIAHLSEVKKDEHQEYYLDQNLKIGLNKNTLILGPYKR